MITFDSSNGDVWDDVPDADDVWNEDDEFLERCAFWDCEGILEPEDDGICSTCGRRQPERHYQDDVD